MTDYSASVTLSGQGSFSPLAPNIIPALAGTGTMVVQGLEFKTLPSGLRFVNRYVGEPNVPGEIKRLRRQTFEMMRRMGQPVLVKKMLIDRDVTDGVAEPSPNFDDIYEQSRNEDPLSYGTGFVSKEKSENEWLDPNGRIAISTISPGAGYIAAPKYRGFGPGVVTYMVEPDVAEDFYKVTPTGVFVKVQQANVVAPWYPDVNDNDLIVHVTLNAQGYIVDVGDRYQARMTNPISIRGDDRRGRYEYSGDLGNRHVINQTFEMALVPRPNILYKVDIDR